MQSDRPDENNSIVSFNEFKKIALYFCLEFDSSREKEKEIQWGKFSLLHLVGLKEGN